MFDSTGLGDSRSSATPRASTRPIANDARASGIVPVSPASTSGQNESTTSVQVSFIDGPSTGRQTHRPAHARAGGAARSTAERNAARSAKLCYCVTSAPKYFSLISARTPSSRSSASAASMAATSASLSFVKVKAL